MNLNRFYAALMVVMLVVGCSGRVALTPNRDKALRKTPAQFAADAAKRHPYKADAPRGGEAVARAQVGYSLNRLDVINLFDEPWNDVEVWVNQKYVVFLPEMKKGDLKTINFEMLYDENGRHFPTKNMQTRIEKVEVLRDGKMYDVSVHLAD